MKRTAGAIAVAAAAGLAGAALVPPANTSSLVSVTAAGGATGAGESYTLALSSNGRYVLFGSAAGDLVAADGNGKYDVFLRDLKKGRTTLVSGNAAGTGGGNGDTFDGRLTPNGRWVAFHSVADDLVGNDFNAAQDVFVRDMKTGDVTLVSVNAAGTASGNQGSRLFAITPSGRYVLFFSVAEDLVADDGNGQADVFVRDLKTRRTTLVSQKLGGAGGGNFGSDGATITPNGRFVVFESIATDLVTADGNGKTDIFVRDMTKGVTTLVSVSRPGGSANNHSGTASISADGRRVVFASNATDLTSDSAIADGNAGGDVFVRDLKTGTTTLVSVNSSGSAAGIFDSRLISSTDAFTSNGRFVVFSSDASDLVAGDGNATRDIFVRDLKAGTTTLVTKKAGAAVSAAGFSFGGRITPNGRFVLFGSNATDLVTDDTNGGTHDVFLRDLKRGTTTLVSRNATGTGSGDGGSFHGNVTPDGRVVTFGGVATDITTPDANAVDDVWVRRIR